jgi:hypothetical protein
MHPSLEPDMLQALARLWVFGEPLPRIFDWTFAGIVSGRKERHRGMSREALADALRDEVRTIADVLRAGLRAQPAAPSLGAPRY